MSTSSIELDGSTLGSGKDGTVYRMEYLGAPVAMKVFGTTTTSRANFSEKARENFINECRILKDLKHDNIVQYLSIARVRIGGQLFPALVMTLMDMSLKHYFFTPEAEDLRKFPHKEIKIANDVAQALHYLHEIAKPNIVHGDLHCGNVLLRYVTAYEGPQVKLCDFVVAKVITSISSQDSDVSAFSSRTTNVEISFDETNHSVALSSTSLGYHSQNDDEAIEENDGAALTPQKRNTEIHRFGTIMWFIHTRAPRLELGTTPRDNLRLIEGRPLYNLVSACWSQDKPSAKTLLEEFKGLKRYFPIKSPLDGFNHTIASQQEVIASQQQTMAYLTTRAIELEKIEKKFRELTAN